MTPRGTFSAMVTRSGLLSFGSPQTRYSPLPSSSRSPVLRIWYRVRGCTPRRRASRVLRIPPWRLNRRRACPAQFCSRDRIRGCLRLSIPALPNICWYFSPVAPFQCDSVNLEILWSPFLPDQLRNQESSESGLSFVTVWRLCIRICIRLSRWTPFRPRTEYFTFSQAQRGSITSPTDRFSEQESESVLGI